MRLIACGALAATLLAATGAAQAAPRLQTLQDVRREMLAISRLSDKTPPRVLDAHVQAILASPAYGQLEPLQQCAVQMIAGLARYGLHDYAGADRYLLRAVECPEIPKETWVVLYSVALQSGDWDGAARALLTLLNRFPAELASFPDRAVRMTVSYARQLEKGSERKYALLDALYEAGWKPSDPSVVMDGGWAELAADLVERGLTIRASRVLQPIRDPWTLAAIRADKRFDALFDHASPDFDPEAQSRIELEFRRKLVADHPDKLAYVVDYADDLMRHLHADLALKLLDDAQARIDAAPKGHPSYADLEEKAVWVKDYRQRALLHLGRVEEALAMEIEASGDMEEGADNVSQVINLAGFYDDLGRPQQALDTLGRLKGGVSPYGQMQAEKVRAIACAQLGDKAGLTKAMDYLNAHQAEAPGALIEPLLWANDLAGAAAAYIRRLENPEQRLGALGDLQDFARPPNPLPTAVTYHERWLAMRARPDLQAAIAKAGRIGRYSFLDAAG